MDSLENSGSWNDFLHFIDPNPSSPTDFLFSNPSVSTEIDFSGGAVFCQESSRKRFCDLSSVLETGRPVKTDKSAILDDTIRVLTQLKTEAQELKETNEKLLEEIQCLKAEKKELREEKLVLKADKERVEKHLKGFSIPHAGFMPPPHVAAYQAGMNKMAVYPNYGYVPMWQYLPISTRDTSHDHELRPPAA
ncbi:hypothetical protein Lal_00034343 [Lupinus albus]|nr:hypothetical protein Lal_00034343 [Lupinus albus]